MTSSVEENQRRNDDLGVPTSIGLLEAKKLFPLVRQPEWHSLYHALALKGRGTPLIYPNPELQQPIEYRKIGHSIGELIIFNIRGFVDLHFNICVPIDSPLNGLPGDIPQGFSPLSPPLDPTNFFEDEPFKGPTVIEGKSQRKLQISGHSPGTIFDAVLENTAIITIPEGVISRDVIDVSCFRKYVAENATGWYKFVNEVGGRHAINGDLRIVIGWDKCRSWSRVLSSLATVHIPDNTMGTAGSVSRHGMTGTRGGKGVLSDTPVDSSEEGEIYQNQTLFLRTLNISVCDDIWSQLAESFRRHNEPSTLPPPDGTPFKWDSQSIATHPANGINAALLKLKPHARFAITQDNDWISVLKPDDTSLPTTDEFLSRILKVYLVCEEDDVVFLGYKSDGASAL
ncbi:hypothetical protein M413DRAFT_448063 [Hebeloma cylindrosporum]|uniref:Uncharacterized protein n=1 Tax=Hebeloma cylindrosporum TaxID=76867 RepID=A0A0C3C333_HEBCY|nr:hypothetical protein M413DRAFT_448063 [Hebeloma cylindrosporum h7]